MGTCGGREGGGVRGRSAAAEARRAAASVRLQSQHDGAAPSGRQEWYRSNDGERPILRWRRAATAAPPPRRAQSMAACGGTVPPPHTHTHLQPHVGRLVQPLGPQVCLGPEGDALLLQLRVQQQLVLLACRRTRGGSSTRGQPGLWCRPRPRLEHRQQRSPAAADAAAGVGQPPQPPQPLAKGQQPSKPPDGRPAPLCCRTSNLARQVRVRRVGHVRARAANDVLLRAVGQKAVESARPSPAQPAPAPPAPQLSSSGRCIAPHLQAAPQGW
jgi:hypothetical protein